MTQNVESVVKLEQAMFDALRKSIPGGTAIVTGQTTELQAGYQLGVQVVLNAIRDGFVYDRS